MKQYLLAVYMVEGEDPPEPEAMQQAYQAVEALNTELQAEGAWVFAGGLYPPTTARVVRVRDGEVVTTDGPFAQTKEHLGGFWVIQAADIDAALGWAARQPKHVERRSRSARSKTNPRNSRAVHRGASRCPPLCGWVRIRSGPDDSL